MPNLSSKGTLPWFALKVKARSELTAEVALRARGFEPYVPKWRERRKYSDRFKIVEAPMFPGYIFCPMDPQHTLPVLSVVAVQYVVGNSSGAISISDEEIAAVQKAADAGAVPVPYMKTGRSARVRFGKLAGVQGIIIRSSSGARLVLSVELLNRSVALEVDEQDVELL
jgi:transcriptional antiterminator NusG